MAQAHLRARHFGAPRGRYRRSVGTEQPPGGPLTESDETMAFLTVYGWAMWVVQAFEYHLAGLTILRSPAKNPSRLIDTAQKAASALEKQFAIYRHRFERASATELTRLLPEDLPGQPPRRTRGARRCSQRASAPLLTANVGRGHARRFEKRASSDASPRTAVRRRQRRPAQADGRRRWGSPAANVSDAQFAALQRLGRAASRGISLEEALTAEGP